MRHDKCEHDEKKKFLSYIKFPLAVGRSRANRRTDSRAESTSGANTPDPMSPHPGETSEAVSSPLTSPPATPISMLTANEDTAAAAQQQQQLRRRTVSQSRWAEHRCNTPPDTAIELVPPYEPRSFPLPEDTYEKMLKYMPEGHPMPKNCLNKQVSRESLSTTDTVTASASATVDSPMFPDHLPPDSPVSSESTESAIPEEDPNDPEWMDAEKIQIRDRTKR